MVHREPVAVSGRLRGICWLVLAYAMVLVLAAGCLLGNRLVIAAGAVPAAILVLVWASRNLHREIMSSDEQAIRDAAGRLDGRPLPVRGFGGEIIEGASATVHADDRGVHTTIVMPPGPMAGVLAAAAAEEIPAMSFRLPGGAIPLEDTSGV